jgi:peptide/nickel transport system permease protein
VRGFLANPVTAAGAFLLFFFVILAAFGPMIAPYGANEQIASEARQPPSPTHLFGTDNLGRDVFSRVVLGARGILFLAGSATFLAVIAGTFMGLVSGYFGSWLDEGIMRLFDALLAIPAVLFALLLLGTIGSSQQSVLLVIVIVYSPIIARVIRSTVLTVKTMEYVETAVLQGENAFSILWKDILPYTVPALSVEAAIRFSYAIFLIASLGFLGVGVQPPNPDWGLMVKEARFHASQMPWTMFFPAAAIALLVIAVNLTADGFKRIWLSQGR